MKRYSVTSTVPPFGQPNSRRPYSYSKSQKTECYDAIFNAGAQGLTRPEIATKVGLRADRISFYLSELKRAGYITVVGDPTTVLTTMTAEEASFAAMLGLENALVARVREDGGATPEQERGFVRYSKIKELALRPGTGPEGRTALRMAILELVKIIY